LTVKFVFGSEFPIETFFKGRSSGLKKKTVVKSIVCRNILRITNFENVDKTLIFYFISVYNFPSEIQIIKSELNVKLNSSVTLKKRT
jgi:hypothetical protein